MKRKSGNPGVDQHQVVGATGRGHILEQDRVAGSPQYRYEAARAMPIEQLKVLGAAEAEIEARLFPVLPLPEQDFRNRRGNKTALCRPGNRRG